MLQLEGGEQVTQGGSEEGIRMGHYILHRAAVAKPQTSVANTTMVCFFQKKS